MSRPATACGSVALARAAARRCDRRSGRQRAAANGRGNRRAQRPENAAGGRERITFRPATASASVNRPLAPCCCGGQTGWSRPDVMGHDRSTRTEGRAIAPAQLAAATGRDNHENSTVQRGQRQGAQTAVAHHTGERKPDITAQAAQWNRGERQGNANSSCAHTAGCSPAAAQARSSPSTAAVAGPHGEAVS